MSGNVLSKYPLNKADFCFPGPTLQLLKNWENDVRKDRHVEDPQYKLAQKLNWWFENTSVSACSLLPWSIYPLSHFKIQALVLTAVSETEWNDRTELRK